jgi:hypothetical protein
MSFLQFIARFYVYIFDGEKYGGKDDKYYGGVHQSRIKTPVVVFTIHCSFQIFCNLIAGQVPRFLNWRRVAASLPFGAVVIIPRLFVAHRAKGHV